MTAIYARQSVDKKESISIETQIEACKRCFEGDFRVYTDKGWSGKNLDRPQFQQLLSDIKSGEIAKLVVYKLDRISRSLCDFSSLMELFRKCGVEFASTVETFDTSTAIGRAMLGIIMVFAELERENILLRVRDNYYARGEKGMFLGGIAAYGFDKIPTSLDGVRTSLLVPNSDISTVEYIFEEYGKSPRSLGDIVKALNKREIPSPAGALWDSGKLSRILRNPVYVCADMEVFRYFKEKGAKISNSAENFTGEHGCFLYGKREANERKYTDVRGHVLSLGLHGGVISSELWLDVQRRLDGNTQLRKGKSGSYSWLTGLLKCGKCGYAMRVVSGEYFYCSGKANHKTCSGLSGKPLISDAEEAVYSQLKQKFLEIKSLRPNGKPQRSPKANRLKMRLEALDEQIDNLVSKLSETTAAIGQVLEERLGRLISERESVRRELEKCSEPPRESYETVIELLDEFPKMPVEVKRRIAEEFISRVLIWEERIEIQWKF